MQNSLEGNSAEESHEIELTPEQLAGMQVVGATPEAANNDQEVTRGQDVTLKATLKILKAAKKEEEVYVGETLVKSPRLAYENLKEALKMVRKYLPFNKRDLYFTNFSGEVVGEATEDEFYIDAESLMHPAWRIAHRIGHELGHRKGEVPNEGAVEAKLRAVGLVQNDGTGVTAEYEEALTSFNEFIERLTGVNNEKKNRKMVNKVYKYYYSGRTDKIEAIYEKKYLKPLDKSLKKARRSDADREYEMRGAREFFFKVFPELSKKAESAVEDIHQDEEKQLAQAA